MPATGLILQVQSAKGRKESKKEPKDQGKKTLNVTDSMDCARRLRATSTSELPLLVKANSARANSASKNSGTLSGVGRVPTQRGWNCLELVTETWALPAGEGLCSHLARHTPCMDPSKVSPSGLSRNGWQSSERGARQVRMEGLVHEQRIEGSMPCGNQVQWQGGQDRASGHLRTRAVEVAAWVARQYSCNRRLGAAAVSGGTAGLGGVRVSGGDSWTPQTHVR